MAKIVLVYSGGMDSTVLLHEYRDEIAIALSFDYGAKHNAQESRMAALNCDRLGIPRRVISLDFMKLFHSSLTTDSLAVPEGHYTDESMRNTVVPFRNGIMLAIAAGIAEDMNCSAVGIANHAGDHAIYPDCTTAFINSMTQAIHHGTYVGIKLMAPYTELTKRQIALTGQQLGVDFSQTWSCYKGGENHCGRCGTCVERREALDGFDPTQYEETD
ncbi:MAG: 7-cyano-7-deazaguanine synthase QueC [Armatimonadota bacterium]